MQQMNRNYLINLTEIKVKIKIKLSCFVALLIFKKNFCCNYVYLNVFTRAGSVISYNVVLTWCRLTQLLRASVMTNGLSFNQRLKFSDSSKTAGLFTNMRCYTIAAELLTKLTSHLCELPKFGLFCELFLLTSVNGSTIL